MKSIKEIDYSSLDEFSESQVEKMNDKIKGYLAVKPDDKELQEAVSYFYLYLSKLEDTSISLSAAHNVMKGFQGEILTLIEATFADTEQRKAMKDIINRYISRALSKMQDINWGRTPDNN